MGKSRLSICLFLSLCLLLSSCGRFGIAMPSQAPLSQAQTAPAPVVQETPALHETPVIENTPAKQAPVSKPETPPVQLRLVMQPPPPPQPPPQPSPAAPPPRSAPKPIPPSATYPKAQSHSSGVKKAEAASLALDRAIQSGALTADYMGTGDLYEMVHVSLYNSSGRPQKVQLVPGMILNPSEGQGVQPLLVVDQADLVLQPGESYTASLNAYCLDSRVPAPQPGEVVNYRFSTRTSDGGPRAVKAHQVAEKLAGSSPYLHAITQIAIWKSLKQPVEDKHFYSVLGPAANDPEVRREVLEVVDQVLKSI